MKKHANISLFVPHRGCKFKCTFCNQVGITSHSDVPHADDVKKAVKTAVSSPNYDAGNTELAFFGGSFTAIEPGYMLELLNAAAPFVKNGTVKGIRLSTRPDAIDDNILTLLKKYGVTAIELGAQSMDNNVLRLNRRGHTAEDVEHASALIKQYGFELGLQMMTGLYGSNNEKDTQTADRLIRLKPQTARIYPTVVIKNTALAELYRKGEYVPQTLQSAVELCARLLDKFKNGGVRVIRVGLHSVSPDSYIAGPFHPSFGELCEGERFYNVISQSVKSKGDYVIFANPRDISKVTGQRKNNITRLKMQGLNCAVSGDGALPKGTIKIQRVDNS